MVMTIDQIKQKDTTLLLARDFVIVGREDTSILAPSERMTYADAFVLLNKQYNRAIADNFSHVNVDMAEGMIEDNCYIDSSSASVEWPDGQLDLQIYYVGNGEINALDTVMKSEYVDKIGNLVIPMIALHNSECISQKKLAERIATGVEQDVILISKALYDSVFYAKPMIRPKKRGGTL